MFRINNVVVLIDPAEDNQSALKKAQIITTTANGKLTLFASGYNSTLANHSNVNPENSEKAKAAFLQRIRANLEEKADTIRQEGLTIECVAVWDKHPSQAIIKYLETNSVDLVIKNTHHQNVMQRTFFSHTDWDLIRYSPAPLLLTKNQAWKGQLTVTAAVDPINNHDKPKTLDAEILSAGLFISEKLDTKLHILHVYDPTPMLIYLDQPVLDTSDVSEEIRKEHLSALDELVSQYPIDHDHVHLECGSPTTVIPDHLYQHDSSIVVMGAVSRQGLDRLLVGHTAERMLDRISADILVVKMHAEDSDNPD
ncbi:universal stress protein [Gynuella sp.]|uniref:universal stress protein n=1 Tax=Gynuella sp. TaxID=2969146 RepID=UPI003D0FD0A4